MTLIGAHLSIKDGFKSIHQKMQALNATCSAFFLKNQRRFHNTPLNATDIDLFKSHFQKKNVFVPHGSYLINMANATETRQKHLDCLDDELLRCEQLDIKFLNMHPGSDTSNLKSRVYQKVADAINEKLKKYEKVTLLLENMAGQGRVIGSNFNELRKIIDLCYHKERVGVCIDTAHLFGAGYDIRTNDSYEKVFAEIDRIIGIENVKAMHINDSKVSLGSKRDRHEQIGKGKIGYDAFKFIMRDERLKNIPKILETPDEAYYSEEIKMLKEFAEKE